MDEFCFKCGRSRENIVHDTFGHQGTGCWIVHPFIGDAEKLLLRQAVNAMSMVMKAGQKGGSLNDQQAHWNLAIESARTQVERMSQPVDSSGAPIQPFLDEFDKYFTVPSPSAVEVCLGCGKPTADRDCGCPAGTGMRNVSH